MRRSGQGGATASGLLLYGLSLAMACGGDRSETQIRELLARYVRLQGTQIVDSGTYASSAPAGLTIPPGIALRVLGGSADGHAAVAYPVVAQDFVCAVRVGPARWDLAAVPSNGEPVCGRRDVVLQPPAADTAPPSEGSAPAAPPPTPPAYARYFPLIARGADLPLDDPAERAEIVLAITHALTEPREQLEPLTALDQDLPPGLRPPEAEGARRRFGRPGAAGWRVEALRNEARQVVRRLDDPALLPVVIHSLVTAQEGRTGEFRAIQTLLVTLTGVDSAPFYVESTPANRRAAEAFWLSRWTATGPRPFAGEQQAIRARQRWERIAQLRAWAADPPSWSEVLQWGARSDLDSATKEAVRGVARALLTEDPVSVAGRMRTIPRTVADLRMRAARYVRATRDTALVPALITALTVPDPDLYRDRQDSVFLNLQETLVAISAADTAPRYVRGGPTDREAAAVFWRAWWRASGGRAPFPPAVDAERRLRRWGILSRRNEPAEWLDLLSRSSPAGDAEIAHHLRSVAIRILTLSPDSLLGLLGSGRDPRSTARALRKRAIRRLRSDPRPEVVSAVILGLERGPPAASRAEAVAESESFYMMQEALVRWTGLVDAPCFAVASRAARDSAAALWRGRWSRDSVRWRPPAQRRATVLAAQWAANRAVPALREDPAFWTTMLTVFPLQAHQVRQALRPLVRDLLAADQDSLQHLLAELGTPLSIELAASLDYSTLTFARVYPHETFVAPLIGRLGRADGAGALADGRFQQMQMALVAISGLASAPRHPVARPAALRDAQEFWSAWWSANERSFTPADSARAARAVHTWLNRRSR